MSQDQRPLSRSEASLRCMMYGRVNLHAVWTRHRAQYILTMLNAVWMCHAACYMNMWYGCCMLYGCWMLHAPCCMVCGNQSAITHVGTCCSAARPKRANLHDPKPAAQPHLHDTLGEKTPNGVFESPVHPHLLNLARFAAGAAEAGSVCSCTISFSHFLISRAFVIIGI